MHEVVPAAAAGPEQVDDPHDQRVHGAEGDRQVLAVPVRHLEQHDAGEGDHRVEVVRAADDAPSEVRVVEQELEDRGRVEDGCGRDVLEVQRDGLDVFAGFETAEDVGAEVQLAEVVVEEHPFDREVTYMFVGLWRSSV